MARQPIVLNGKEFKFQKNAKEYFKQMLERYRNGQTVNTDDHEMLLALIERHPEADKKIGCGVKRLYKDRTDMPTSCFWIEREDGSKTDFSYPTAIAAREKSLYQEFFEACRNAVQDDLKKTKEQFFGKFADETGKVKCDITGEKVAIYESHLDHKKPLTLQVIVNTFLAANEIEIKPEMLSLSQDAQFQTTFLDIEIKDKFKRYHHKIADLRIIKTELNLSLGGSERILKSKKPVIIPKELFDD
ncbi:DCL family protein [Nostoc sp. WHI]|uniref:DCL family protein n=1 Tax=Nostoc sp. WHI TaxID=2650611 RepID=UPI0018C65151|nr:DCL family protein [Nostoc sp. WHI]MBG1269427.1 DCL family protein [Nostoc sp. WHI]